MSITVAICTWNRAEVLAGTLNALTRLDSLDGLEEVLVIDNNSTDQTPNVVEQFAGRLPLRRLFEPRQGVAHARNRAVRDVRSPWLLFLDDDCRPSSGWLMAYRHAIQRWPEATLFGGPIVPDFAAAPPAWVQGNLKRLSPVFGSLDHGPDDRELKADEGLLSGNLAVATDAARAVPFRTDLGRVAQSRMGGEELDFVSRLRSTGHLARWVAAAGVQHFLSPPQMTSRYMIDSFVGVGQFEARTQLDRSAGVPRWVLRRWFESTICSIALWPFKNRRWLLATTEAARMRGIIRELRGCG